MSDLRTAAQQALNALGCLEYSFCGITDGPSEDTTEAAITALRAALAERDELLEVVRDAITTLDRAGYPIAASELRNAVAKQ